jgi:predicted DNA-binding transcriptional regulator AlpA
MRYLRHEDLPEKGIRYSKAQIWRLRQLPAGDPRKFPEPVKGLGAVDVWAEMAVDAYVERRVAASNQEQAA